MGRRSMRGERLACCVPFCRRTTRNDEGYALWICGKHWSLVPYKLRAEYNAAKRTARRIIRRRPTSRVAWARADRIWCQCRDAAIEQAMGV